MYQASVPRFISILENLDQILDQTLVHIESKKLDVHSIIDFRLFPDMFSMCRQIQIACDMAQGSIARLAGVEIPTNEDNEQNIQDLKGRISKTISYIQGFTPDQIDGTEAKVIITKRHEKKTHYEGMQYLLDHAIPNIYFHVTTAYNILRHNGVEIGKRDYLGTR